MTASVGRPPDGPHPPPPSTAKILFGRYEIGRLLGIGAFAKVYHARQTQSGQSVAIKVINKVKVLRGGLSGHIKREIAVMRLLRHPHVIRLFEVLASRSKIYFVMEYAKGGELFARVARGRLPEDQARRFFHQLVSAIEFCHARGVFHRDLKPENLLLDESGNLKVSDFGLSAIAADQIRDDGLLHTLCGTPAYVAPEILSKKGYDGAKADIWSCGVILFVLNAGFLPFNDPNLMAMYRKIYQGDYRCPRWTSPELRQLISRLLDTNPITRITVEGILHDPWFRKELEVEKMRRLMRFRQDVEEKMEEGIGEDDDRDLNAFDIISMSSGFDLSGFFNPAKAARQWFAAEKPGEVILDKLEAVGRREGLVVRRRWRGQSSRGGAAMEGRSGGLIVWVEVFRLSSGLVIVEVERGSCEEAEQWSAEFWRDILSTNGTPTMTPVRGPSSPDTLTVSTSSASVATP